MVSGIISAQSKKEGKDQESIQSSSTLDPGYQWESNKLTIRHHKLSSLKVLSFQIQARADPDQMWYDDVISADNQVLHSLPK